MKVGLQSVLYSSAKPFPSTDEKSIILAYAYKLAYEEYFKNSIGKWFSRALGIAKPKRVTVIARLSYELQIVPFDQNQVFISDTCSPCTEKIGVLSFDTLSIDQSTKIEKISAERISDQTTFLKQLKIIGLTTSNFKKTFFGSPFLLSSDAAVIEILSYFSRMEMPSEFSTLITLGTQTANHPEALSNALSLFVKNYSCYLSAIELARGRVLACSKDMITRVNLRNPISKYTFHSMADFGWKIPDVCLPNVAGFITPVHRLIKGLEDEVKPDIEKISKESNIEINRLEQNSKLKVREIEHKYDYQIENLTRELDLALRRLKTNEEYLDNQIEVLQSEYKKAASAYRSAESKYDSAVNLDTTGTSEALLESAERLKQQRDDLKSQLDDNKQALSAIQSQYDTVKKLNDSNIESLRQKKVSELKEISDRLEVAIDAVQEAKKRSIDEKLVHAHAIGREKVLLEELIKNSTTYNSEVFITKEQLCLPEFWNDATLIDLKVNAIEELSRRIITDLDDATKSMEQTRKYLQDHLIRTNFNLSITTEIVIPFWYIQIESGPQINPTIERFIIPPSEVPMHNVEDKSAIFSLKLIPRLPAIGSILNSLRNYPNMATQGASANRIKELTLTTFLPSNHWLVSRHFISQNFYKELQKNCR